MHGRSALVMVDDPLTQFLSAASATGRSCGSCTLCCKVYDVAVIDNKPRGVWCKHCAPGKGCGIWQERPDFCRDFSCHWLKDTSFGDEWKPERSKLVMNYRPDDNAMAVMVDPATPKAWRKEPYHSGLRMLAATLARRQHILQIVVNHDTTVISSTRDFHVGGPFDRLNLRWRRIQTAGGESFELEAVDPVRVAVA
jgi:hypothetical protein